MIKSFIWLILFIFLGYYYILNGLYCRSDGYAIYIHRNSQVSRGEIKVRLRSGEETIGLGTQKIRENIDCVVFKATEITTKTTRA
jgi:hypothetical protein